MFFRKRPRCAGRRLSGQKTLMFALERRRAAVTPGCTRTVSKLQNIKARLRSPTSPGVQVQGQSGLREVSGALRYIKWDDMLDDQYETINVCSHY